MMTTKIKLLGFSLLIHSLGFAETFKDQDLDGVEDSVDLCPNTPFLHKVNAQGCTTTILKLPGETESDSATLSIGYGYNTNNDLAGRETQKSTRAQFGYYHDNWSYLLSTGYYTHNKDNGSLDTLLKIKKRFTPRKALKVSLGAGVKLPSYDFTGNKTDFTLYTSTTYYASHSMSYFAGISYTFIRDEKIKTPLQNTLNFYLGAGYFFTTSLYTNLSYSNAQSKFTTEHRAQALSSTLYYKINKKFFTTLSYQREIDDEDLHDSLYLKIGYKLW